MIDASQITNDGSGTYDKVMCFRFIEWNEATEEVDDLSDLVRGDRILYVYLADQAACLSYSTFGSKLYYHADDIYEVFSKIAADIPNGQKLMGLAQSVMDEDEDGMYDILEENGGQLEFCSELDPPSDFSESGVGCLFVSADTLEIKVNSENGEYTISVDGNKNLSIDDIIGYVDANETRSLVYFGD